MEENQKELREECSVCDQPDAENLNNTLAEQAPLAEIPANEDGQETQDEETFFAEQAQDAPDEIETPPEEVLGWNFDTKRDAVAEKKKKKEKIAFFAIFGSVFAICLALLILLLFVGDGAIRVFRTLHTERTVYVREDDGSSGLLTPQEAADVMRKSTVTVSVKTADNSGIGSGFVYDNNGHICTNYHVIEDAVSVQVVLPDGKAVNAEVVGYDVDADLAVLRVQASGLVPVTFGSSANLLVGDEVVAVGTPASTMFSGSATFGKVSYANRLLPVDDNGDGTYEKKIRVIQTDTSVNPGNSGGPMADMYGRVVGVVVRKISSFNGSLYEGIGFAIPIDGARVILDEIIEKGSFTGENPVTEGRSLLGVTGHPGKQGMWYYADPLTSKVLSSEQETEGYHYMPVDGVYVIAINHVNAKNKIYPGDVILSVNGLTVRDTQELITAVNCFPCGEVVSVCVWRNDAQVTVDILLAEE